MHHHMRPKLLSPIISPIKCCDVHDVDVFQVPHIHPTHTTVHHHNIFEHLHSFPQTVSHVSDVAHQHFKCPPGMMPGVGPGMAPGMGFGGGLGMPGPGMAGPGMMGPGMMPPGMGPTPFMRP
ncbi:CotD family spore coat protein [Calidifontibacillus oryziterrae]|uniref:CotD family spore coat protein n=1 Tax=Calidifontibacillus oryziterrae TaxID=1191699 RepID=UPI00037AE5A6|nr:CotD family spore coat protein [Calidifontibacillus oryziterrae]